MTMWLIGMMGSGKTTIGERTASELGVPFYDTDRMVGEMTGMSVNQVWEGVGESGFRELERRAVATVPELGVVAAAGGGAVLDRSNQKHLRLGGQVIWLRCDPVQLAERMTDSTTRPLLNGETPIGDRLTEILAERAGTYSTLATHVIDTDSRSVTEVVSDVVGMWQG